MFAIPDRMATRQILHVDLDAFFVAVEQARDPSLGERRLWLAATPAAAASSPPHRMRRRVFGVHSAMPLRTAKRLAAAHAIFLRGDFKEYQRVSRAFHAILADCTPLVESGGLDEAYIDITGCEALVGTPDEAAAMIRARIRDELSMAASVGIATSRLVAKVASDAAKPDGVKLVPRAKKRPSWRRCRCGRCRCSVQQWNASWRRWGLTTLGQLASLPLATLQAAVREARGGHLAAQPGHRPVAGGWGTAPRSISREGTFGSDVSDPEHLRAVLRAFSESVASQLRPAA